MKEHKFATIVVFASVLSIAAVSILFNTARAQEQTFSATMSGKDEVSPSKSNSTGTAKFSINENGTKVSYWVNITGIKKLNQAHIEEKNGDAVLILSKGKSAKGNESPPQIGFAGNATKKDLEGPLKGKDISDLVKLMSEGSAYVDTHTDKYPKGAIRGQISSGEGQQQANATEG